MEADPIDTLYSNLITVDLVFISLFIVNMVLTAKDKGNLFAGYNKILTIIIILFLVLFLVMSYMIINDPESDEDLVAAFVAFGLFFPIIILVLYFIVYMFISRNVKAAEKIPSATAASPKQEVSNPLLKKKEGGGYKRRTQSKK